MLRQREEAEVLLGMLDGLTGIDFDLVVDDPLLDNFSLSLPDQYALACSIHHRLLTFA